MSEILGDFPSPSCGIESSSSSSLLSPSLTPARHSPPPSHTFSPLTPPHILSLLHSSIYSFHLPLSYIFIPSIHPHIFFLFHLSTYPLFLPHIISSTLPYILYPIHTYAHPSSLPLHISSSLPHIFYSTHTSFPSIPPHSLPFHPSTVTQRGAPPQPCPLSYIIRSSQGSGHHQ